MLVEVVLETPASRATAATVIAFPDRRSFVIAARAAFSAVSALRRLAAMMPSVRRTGTGLLTGGAGVRRGWRGARRW